MSKEEITVNAVLKVWLAAAGYDGLVSDDSECGCLISDLAPCDGPCMTCRPGYKGPGNEESDWLIYSSKEARDRAEQQRSSETDT